MIFQGSGSKHRISNNLADVSRGGAHEPTSNRVPFQSPFFPAAASQNVNQTVGKSQMRPPPPREPPRPPSRLTLNPRPYETTRIPDVMRSPQTVTAAPLDQTIFMGNSNSRPRTSQGSSFFGMQESSIEIGLRHDLISNVHRSI